MAILELKDVSYIYPGSTGAALDNISLIIETGQHIALLGANGSGKSTLAGIAAGLFNPTSGEVISSGNESYRGWNGMGLLFQNPDEQLLCQNVESEIAWGLENIGVHPDEMRVRVCETLEMFELTNKAKTSPDTLSDGWKQITALAAIVAMHPDFLILDEVTAFLDPYWTTKIRRMIGKLTERSGLLWISTNTIDAMHADEVLVIRNGQIVTKGTPQVVLNTELLKNAGIEPIHNSIER
ncbi:MAG: ATP-binding cassette domain-containing protein [Candidatus Hatepunaea meridiana]|nr:ATP-binding cassette domain-containing protein [Candidatus Hatepunaea meridiana]